MIKQRNVIKDSEELHGALKKRLFEELELTQAQIIHDAKDRGFDISSSQLSKYFNHHREIHSLNEEQIVWLCYRYGIDLTLNIGKPITASKWKVTPYIEEDALNKLKLVFPDTVTPKPVAVSAKQKA